MTVRCNVSKLYRMTQRVVCVCVCVVSSKRSRVLFIYRGRVCSSPAIDPDPLRLRRPDKHSFKSETTCTFLRRSIHSMEDIGGYSDTHPHMPTHLYVYTDNEL